MARRAVLTATSGPNEGDTISIEVGSCRLIGRHLSENETALIGKDGNRLLDGPANDILGKHLKKRAPGSPGGPARISADSFERGPDVILADDSISRAHAMVFFDPKGVGVIDLASTNGTFLNQERVTSAMVTDGDTLTIGNSELIIKMR